MNQTALHKVFIGCAGFLLGSFVVALALHSTNQPSADTNKGAPQIENVSDVYSGETMIKIAKTTVPDAYGPTGLFHILDAVTDKVLYAAHSDVNGGLTLSIGKGDDSGMISVHDVDAAGDASTTTDAVFVDGVENIRGTFSHNASQLFIKRGEQGMYTVTPRYASDVCSKDSWPPASTPRKTAQLTGVTVINGHTPQDFNLTKAVNVPCDFDPNIGQMNPGFKNISFAENAVRFLLVDGTPVRMSFNPETSEFTVNFDQAK